MSLDKQEKRQLSRDFKERKVTPGIYALRCLATDQCWIAISRNLDAQQNSAWFTLHNGSHMNRALQAVWTEKGAAAFAFEIVERMEDEELPSYALQSLLKERLAYWRQTLKADSALG